jgi:hypothetical protein
MTLQGRLEGECPSNPLTREKSRITLNTLFYAAVELMLQTQFNVQGRLYSCVHKRKKVIVRSKGKMKVKTVPLHATKANWRRGGTAPTHVCPRH